MIRIRRRVRGAAEQKCIYFVRDPLKTGARPGAGAIYLLLSLIYQALDLLFGACGQIADAAEARDDQQADQRNDHRRHRQLRRHQPLREIDEG